MSLYAAYALNEGSGSTVYDYSGNGRNMTISGSNSWITGKYYTSAFQSGATGSDGAQWDAGSAQAALSNDVTLMVWYQHTTTANTDSHAGGFYSSAGTARLSAWSYRNLSAVAASPQATVRDSAGTLTSFGINATSSDSSWHHAAFVYHSSGLIEEYLDGTLVKSASPTANAIGVQVRLIGVGSILSSALAQAAVQDMRVFDAALTAADVGIYMNTPVVNKVVMPPTMQAARVLLRRRTQNQLAAPAPSGAANVTGVGALVTAAGGIGSVSAGQNITGTGAQVNVTGGTGTPSGAANVTGVGAQVNVTGGTGTLSGSANVTGVGAAVSVAGGVGTPSGSASTAGAGAQVTVAAGAGTSSGSANVTGVGAQVNVVAGAGTLSASENLTGTGALVNVAGGIGTPSGSANATGVGALVNVTAGTGTPSGTANVTGTGAMVNDAGGIGVPSGSANVTGVGALVNVTAGTGTPLSGGAANVTGVGAQVNVAAGTGSVSAGVNVTGVGAQVSVSCGIGVPRASASVTGSGALVVVTAGTGTPAGTINGSANVQGVGAVIAVMAGLGTPVGGTVILLDAKCTMSFRARTAVTGQSAISFEAGQPSQAGLATLASDPWTSMYPDTL